MRQFRFCPLMLSLFLLGGCQSTAQTAAGSSGEAEVRGLYNWIHTTAQGELTFPFYRDMFGMVLVASPFGGPVPAGAPPPRIRPASEARSDELIWKLTDSEGSRFRNIFMHTPNTPFGLELSEFYDIPRSERPASPWDPGASRLIFHVRNLEELYARLREGNTPVVSLEGIQTTAAGRSVLIRDPDAYLIELVQASAREIAAAVAPDEEVIATHIGLTVADTARSLRYYQNLLGFQLLATRQGSAVDLQLNGLAGGSLNQTTLQIPGTETQVVLSEFQVPAGTVPPPRALTWGIEDVGSPQFQLQVSNLDSLITRTQEAGYDFLSWDAEPIQRAFGRFVFAIDPDGILVEYVEPAC